jgi:hypothetical protein
MGVWEGMSMGVWEGGCGNEDGNGTGTGIVGMVGMVVDGGR